MQPNRERNLVFIRASKRDEHWAEETNRQDHVRGRAKREEDHDVVDGEEHGEVQLIRWIECLNQVLVL